MRRGFEILPLLRFEVCGLAQGLLLLAEVELLGEVQRRSCQRRSLLILDQIKLIVGYY